MVKQANEIKKANRPTVTDLPVMSYRRTTESNSKLVFCSDYCKKLLGYDSEELVNEPRMPFVRFIHPDDRDRIINQTKQAAKNEQDYRLKYRIITRDKHINWVMDQGCTVFDQSSQFYQGIISKISHHEKNTNTSTTKTQNSDDRFTRKYDVLTEFSNRHWFLEQVDAKVQTYKDVATEKDEFALILIDLDNFQKINDFFGRDVGDSIIKKMSLMLAEALGDTGIIGRMSGDRFGIFVPQNTIHQVEEFIHENIAPFSRQFQIDDIDITQEFSVGLAHYPRDGENLENLLTSANRALKRAKEKVNEKIATFKESDQDLLNAEIDARDKILNALEQDNVRVFYQPIVDVEDKDTKIYEALLRLQTEDGELFGVNEYKEVIHKGKISRRLDRTIIQKSLQEFESKISSNGSSLLAVNLFPPSVIDPGCFDEIHDLIKQSNLTLDQIIIEIPETLMLSHRERATENIIRASEDLDLRFALDDFGVGHGSFKSLNTLPIDFLKIDGTFIKDLSSNNVEKKFVEMTAGLSDHMDLKVIGEWIESKQTADLLDNLGVSYQQGYYHAHPEPANTWVD